MRRWQSDPAACIGLRSFGWIHTHTRALGTAASAGQQKPPRLSWGCFLPCDSEAKTGARCRWTLLMAHGSCWLWSSQLLALSLCRCPFLWLPSRPLVPVLSGVNLLPMESVRAIHPTPEPLFVKAGASQRWDTASVEKTCFPLLCSTLSAPFRCHSLHCFSVC